MLICVSSWTLATSLFLWEFERMVSENPRPCWGMIQRDQCDCETEFYYPNLFRKKSDWLIFTLYCSDMLRDSSNTRVHIEEMAPWGDETRTEDKGQPPQRQQDLEQIRETVVVFESYLQNI